MNLFFNTSSLFVLVRKQEKGVVKTRLSVRWLISCARLSSSFISFPRSCARWSVAKYQGWFRHIISATSLPLLHIRTTIWETKCFLFNKSLSTRIYIFVFVPDKEQRHIDIWGVLFFFFLKDKDMNFRRSNFCRTFMNFFSWLKNR